VKTVIRSFHEVGRRLLVFPLILIGLAPHAVHAQEGARWDPQGVQMERSELRSLLERLEAAARSPAYSDHLRQRAQADADALRARLERGDLRVGDRIVLSVRGEPQLPDTLIVERGPRIVLPVIGPISLEGVLRSELESYLTRELGRFFQDPEVRARALIRLSIRGSVGSPGFFTMPADMLLSDALMRAGGPAQDANLDEVRIERGDRTVLRGENVQDALVEGRTLDQLNLRAGDEIFVPARQGRRWWSIPLRIGVPIATSLLLGFRVFTGGF